MNKLKKPFVFLKNRILPIEKNTVLFRSFTGQYNDNPKAIALQLREKAPNLQIVWVRSSKSREEFPSYVKVVEYESEEYYRYILRAQVVVDNYVGLRCSLGSGLNGTIKNFFFVNKRKKQLCVSTWHGTPLKRIGADEIQKSNKDTHYYTCSDYIVAGCNLT